MGDRHADRHVDAKTGREGQTDKNTDGQTDTKTDRQIEKENRTYFHPFPYKHEPGHFTQVVWKASREAGFGKAKTKDGKCFVVGSYRPAGNLIGSFVENVPPRKDGKILTKAELTAGKSKK